MDSREDVRRRFRNRAMLVLYPLAFVLLGGGVLLAANDHAAGLVLLALLVVLTVVWNAYYFVFWRPRFERRFPSTTAG